jgi:cation diffusion facilitator family transporter
LFITTKIRHQAASLALFATLGLTVLKLGTAYVSNSVGVLSEGVHSFLDLVSAALSFFTVREAGKPADQDHPFGHGKIETLSSLFESLLLAIAAGLIFYEGLEHIRNPEPIQYEGLAIGIMIFSILASYAVYYHNSSAARETESSALHVNALHFLSDVVASAGILIGLILLKWTGWLWLDPVIAFVVAAYILVVSAKQVKEALAELADTQLPEEEVQTIRNLFSQFQKEMIEAHDLRTRKSGSTRHIDFHLVVCGNMSVEASHSLCDEIESRITDQFPRASVTIHVEPCEKERTQCHLTCAILQKK